MFLPSKNLKCILIPSRTLKEIVSIFLTYYPERLKTAFLYNAPRYRILFHIDPFFFHEIESLQHHGGQLTPFSIILCMCVSIFSFTFRIISAFLNEVTRSKLKFVYPPKAPGSPNSEEVKKESSPTASEKSPLDALFEAIPPQKLLSCVGGCLDWEFDTSGEYFEMVKSTYYNKTSK